MRHYDGQRQLSKKARAGDGFCRRFRVPRPAGVRVTEGQRRAGYRGPLPAGFGLAGRLCRSSSGDSRWPRRRPGAAAAGGSLATICQFKFCTGAPEWPRPSAQMPKQPLLPAAASSGRVFSRPLRALTAAHPLRLLRQGRVAVAGVPPQLQAGSNKSESVERRRGAMLRCVIAWEPWSTVPASDGQDPAVIIGTH